MASARTYWSRQLPAFEAAVRAGRHGALGDARARVRRSPEVAGTCNFTQIAKGAFRACFLGFQVARAHEGRGLMREALGASVEYAFRELRLHRIMANHRPENARSAKLLDRLGFVQEGYAREYLFIDGAWRDHVLTSKTNPQFDTSWLLD